MTRTMIAAVTLGNGGFEMIEIQQVPIPTPAAGEVRLKVLAAGMNNTEINTRLGWYSADVEASPMPSPALPTARFAVTTAAGTRRPRGH